MIMGVTEMIEHATFIQYSNTPHIAMYYVAIQPSMIHNIHSGISRVGD